MTPSLVIPAKTGIHLWPAIDRDGISWPPACAGVTTGSATLRVEIGASA